MTQILETTTNRMKIRDFGTCISLNGTNAYATLGSNTLNLINSPSSKFSITGWVNGVVSNGRIFSEGNTNGTPTYDVLCDPTDNKKIQIWIKNDAGTALRLTTTAGRILHDGWNFLVLTDDNGTIKFYNDSVYVETMSYTRSGTFTMNKTQLGARSISSPSSFYRGLLDDFRFFPGAVLTQEQIDDLYYKGVNPSTPLASYQMDEGSGTSLTDSSGNGYTGALTNATYSTSVVMKPRVAASGRVAVSGRVEV